MIGCFPEASIVDAPDGSSVVAIPSVPLPEGWSINTAEVWFVMPVGYPAAKPDCFWASPDLRLASGGQPSNSGHQQVPILGVPALWFSWHLASWRPAHDTLLTYTRFVLRRFNDAR